MGRGDTGVAERVEFDYMRTPLRRYTFENKRICEWVRAQCYGSVLNLFAGKTTVCESEVRNDVDPSMPAEYHLDALAFAERWPAEPFDTVILDPPYSYRKSMEMYGGRVQSPFNAMKDALLRILAPEGRVITFGYHSNVMGGKRGFELVKLLVMSHGGAIHDTIAAVEDRTSVVG